MFNTRYNKNIESKLGCILLTSTQLIAIPCC